MKPLFVAFLVAYSLLVSHAYAQEGNERCDEPVLLLVGTNENDAQVHVSREIKNYLNSKADKIIVPIVVVGPMRSGKSFFLNYITQCPNKFTVGHKEKSETHGAWAFPIEVDDKVYLYIDTEGSGDVKGSTMHDKPILQYSMLIASHMVYHMKENLKYEDIMYLSAVTDLIHDFENENVSETIKLPSMTWVIERYTYKKTDSDKVDESALEEIGETKMKNPRQVLRCTTKLCKA